MPAILVVATAVQFWAGRGFYSAAWAAATSSSRFDLPSSVASRSRLSAALRARAVMSSHRATALYRPVVPENLTRITGYTDDGPPTRPANTGAVIGGAVRSLLFVALALGVLWAGAHRRVSAMAMAAALVALAAVAGVGAYLATRPPVPTADATPALAVLPFETEDDGDIA